MLAILQFLEKHDADTFCVTEVNLIEDGKWKRCDGPQVQTLQKR